MFCEQMRLSSATAFRITMLSILALPVMAGCGGSYYGPSEYELAKQKQQGFSDLIAEAGGTASKEGKRMFGFEMTGWLVDLSGAEISDDLIESITEVAAKDAVFQLVLSKSTITDDQLSQLADGGVFQKMVVLDVTETAVTDAGLDRLTDVHCITELKLKGSSATKAGAARLGSRQIANPDTPAPFKKQPKVDI
ncbi:MAG: hypothetical protein R3C19_03350 [Planctomycetaceae bacterium]